MIEQFWDREKEVSWLQSKNKEPDATLLILYGRRRLGKTELLKQFLKNRKHVYFLVGKKPEKMMRADLQKEMASFLNDDMFNKIQFADWEDLFSTFLNKADHPIIVIDEFPYLIEENNDIPSLFQKIWDEHLQQKPCLMVLCGSSVRMMETKVLDVKSPLYGRRSGQWKLDPFPFSLFHKLFSHHSFEERVQFFSFLDGVPAYINKMNFKETVDWNLKNKVLKRGEYLYEEAEYLLREELRTPRNYYAILQAIAEGYTRFGQIANRTELSKSLVSQYLKNLQELHVVKKMVPVTQRKESRNALYQLSDNYFSFWFQFIYPYQQLIELDKQNMLLQSIREQLNKHYSFTFEQVCQELLSQGSFSKIGSWWDKTEEIDVVGLDELHNRIVFGECKWTKKKVGMNIFERLLEKSNCVSWKNDKRTESFTLFSKSGFTKRLMEEANQRDNVYLFAAKDISKLFKNQNNPFV
ncbi:MAG: ATP-binding protein [Candidatus Thermoplasmatota archaeon]|nr:ATP-binding protein [Candidatus Thermoplasmatota archaeon]